MERKRRYAALPDLWEGTGGWIVQEIARSTPAQRRRQAKAGLCPVLDTEDEARAYVDALHRGDTATKERTLRRGRGRRQNRMGRTPRSDRAGGSR